MSYALHQRLVSATAGNHPNRTMKSIEYITIHNTGNHAATAGAKSHAFYQSAGSGGSKASWHYTVDSKEVWQSFLDHQECWHAGDGAGAGNRSSIGIEICVNDMGGFRAACDNAAHLTASLLKKHGLSVDRVVQHHHWSGKNCPKELRSGAWGVNWGAFVANVKKYTGGDQVTVGEARKLVKEKAGLEDQTMQFLSLYKYGDDLFMKLAKAMERL